MILFLRILPFLVGLLQACAFWYQAQQPQVYPWLVLAAWGAVLAASIAISWRQIFERHITWQALLFKMTPTFVTLACVDFGLLLVEGSAQFWIIAVLASLISFFSLELLFLQSYDLVAYPVNGISRVNVGYVPIAVWYASATSIGLITFLHSNAAWHVVMMACLGAVLFRTTGHHDTTPHQARLWTLIGILVGVEVGVMGVFLPLGMQSQGLFAALLFSAVLRARRYVYQPIPSRKVVYTESFIALVVFIATFATSRWI